MLHVILADGFEETEAFTTVDILRRCGLPVQIVSITGKRLICGAHGISTMADNIFRHSGVTGSEGIILPGGMPGAENLLAFEGLRKALVAQNLRHRLIAAICAAPMVLGRLNILEGRRATCYPGFEEHLKNALITSAMVEVDGNIITARGPAAVTDFAFVIAARFVPPSVTAGVRHDMLIDA